MYFLEKIDFSWSLFLDRDGVINKRIQDDYVKSFAEFKFAENALKAFPVFKNLFSTIVVITNQQGIGKGLMTVSQLDDIHKQMISEIEKNDGKINNVYYCPDLNNTGSLYRKPAIGMGLKAKKDFRSINFKKSIMIGDSVSDMKFGKRLGMKTVFISDNNLKAIENPGLIDIISPSLYNFSQLLISYTNHV